MVNGLRRRRRRERPLRELPRQVRPLVVTGVGLGIGSSLIGQIGGPTAVASQRGLSTFAGFLPVVGAGLGGAAVIRTTRLLRPPRRFRAESRRPRIRTTGRNF